ncbi:MAG: hypothetical protein LBE91_11380 [Tannerella sp.]|jgi:hypothetical protein|nr:hypothetical protein [Tannerella sp.]
MNLRHFFEKHFVIFTSRNRPNIPGRFSYGKVSIWPRTVIGWLLTVFLILLIFFSSRLFSGTDSKRRGHVGTGLSRTNFSNQWRCKFRYLDGGIQGGFTAKSDSAQLIHSSNLENGTIVFYLYNSKNSHLATFLANNTTDTIKGIFHKGERYKVNAFVSKAKGRFDFKME